jgi:death-on-curing protein
LSQNPAFIDGNKPVAFAAMQTFLVINGMRLVIDEDEACAFVVGLYEANRFRFENLVPWLREHVRIQS